MVEVEKQDKRYLQKKNELETKLKQAEYNVQQLEKFIESQKSQLEHIDNQK